MSALSKEEIKCALEIYNDYCKRQKEYQHAKEILNLINCDECQYWKTIKQWSAEGGQLGACSFHKELYSQEGDYCSFGKRKEVEK